jgi:hypothetical protein
VNDPTKKKRYRVEAYVATLRGEEAEVVEQPPGCESQWQGDGYLFYKYEGPGDRQAEWFRDARPVWYQLRELVQTRVFITYSLHRPVSGTREGEDILLKMGGAVSALFGNDEWLSQMLKFGKPLVWALATAMSRAC